MSTETGDDESSTSEFGVGRLFPSDPEITAEERRRLRTHYGWVRTYFKTRSERYAPVQRWLNQARVGTTYDLYLTRSVWLAVLATLVGVLVGGGFAWYLETVGILAGLTSPIWIPGGLGEFISTYRMWFAGGAITLASALTLGLGTWTLRYYYPRYVVSERAREIDLMLPHSITYMYALSRGGTNLTEVIESVADAEDTYGEIANEFDVIVRDVNVFGSDLFTALRNARNVTPSDGMERFLDDLLAVLESGGDPTVFFEEQSDKFLKEAKERQEDFLETLSLLSELFIFAFIAAPLFVIVTLMVMSFIGGSTLVQMAVLIYVGLPLGMVGFLLLVDALSAPYVQPGGTLDVDPIDEEPVDTRAMADDERYRTFQRRKRRKWIRTLARNPLRSVTERPLLTLVASVPAAAAYVVALVAQGFVDPSAGVLLADPVRNTTLLVVVPLLVVTVPLSVFYERERARRTQIAQRFPDTLNILSSANAMGIRLPEALGLVSRYSTGAIAGEMRKVRNDIEWNHNPRRALLLLGNRLKVPHLTRSIKLIADGGRSSADLTRILSIAAEDARNRARVENKRRRAMTSYIAIVVIGFLVYLMVIVLLDSSYLQPFIAVSESAPEPEPGQRGLPISFSGVPLETYRALFFHSVIIQGFGAGILAGKLAENDALSGLKYSIALVLLSVGVFLLI